MTKALIITGIAIFFVFSLFLLSFSQETLTITTYYPSPYGSYRELRADQIAIGSSYRDPTANPLSDGNLIIAGNVGIGTTTPTTRLQINGPATGAIRIVDGNQAAGRVLTSDANGVGTWQWQQGIGLRTDMPLVIQSQCCSPTINNGSPPIDAWQTIAITGFTGIVPRAVILHVASNEDTIYIRPTGSGWAINDRRVWCLVARDNQNRTATAIVFVDSLGRFDWRVHRNDPATHHASIWLVGWIP